MSTNTLQSIMKYATYGAAVLIAGPIISLAADSVVTASGSNDATLLTSRMEFSVAFVYVLAMVLASTVGIVGAIVATRRVAMAAVGLTLAWPAQTLGNVESILRDAHAPDAIAGALTSMGIEALLLLVPLVLVLHLATRLGDVNAPAEFRAFPDPAPLLSKDSALALVTACGVTAVTLYFAMQNPYNGQAIGASAIAAALGAFAAHGAAPRAGIAVAFAGAMLTAVLGPLVVRFALLPSDPIAALYAGELPPVILAHAWHVAAGAALGVPVGDAWARSLIEKHAPKAEHAPA